MKKQAMFAKTCRLLQDEALPSSVGTNKSNMDNDKLNGSSDLKANRPAAARCGPQIQQNMSEHAPRARTAAPFLNHTVLTPAQKEFLYTIAASHSAAHARGLITQHYLNVLHACIHTDYSPKEEELVGTTDKSVKHHSEVSREKSKAKINNRERNTENYQSPNRRARIFNISASKQRKMKQFQHQRSPKRRARISLLEEEEDEEKGLDDSLSELLNSLSVGDLHPH